MCSSGPRRCRAGSRCDRWWSTSSWPLRASASSAEPLSVSSRATFAHRLHRCGHLAPQVVQRFGNVCLSVAEAVSSTQSRCGYTAVGHLILWWQTIVLTVRHLHAVDACAPSAMRLPMWVRASHPLLHTFRCAVRQLSEWCASGVQPPQGQRALTSPTAMEPSDRTQGSTCPVRCASSLRHM